MFQINPKWAIGVVLSLLYLMAGCAPDQAMIEIDRSSQSAVPVLDEVTTVPTPTLKATAAVENQPPTQTVTPLPPVPTQVTDPQPTAVPTDFAATDPIEPIKGPPLNPGQNELWIDHVINGEVVARPVYIQMPESIDPSRSYPIVFAFHGAGGSGKSFLRHTQLNRLINSGEFVGVYPTGYSNLDRPGGFWRVESEPTDADDVEFVGIIMQYLASYEALDTDRVYGIGISNGASMVNLLGKSSTHFNAIAPLFSQQLVSVGELSNSTPVSVFQVSGSEDRLIPLNGGRSPVGEFLSAEASAAEWAGQFECNESPVTETTAWGSTSIDATLFSDCAGEHEIQYLVAWGIGHEGFREGAAQIDMFDEIWAFFQKH